MAKEGERKINPPKKRWGLLDVLIVLVMLFVAAIGAMEEIVIVKVICLVLFIIAGLLLFFSLLSSHKSKSAEHSELSLGETMDSETPSRLKFHPPQKKITLNDFQSRWETEAGFEIRQKESSPQFTHNRTTEHIFVRKDEKERSEMLERMGINTIDALKRQTVDIKLSDFFGAESRHFIGEQGPKGEFDFLLSKVLAVVKDVLPAHTVALFWANKEKRQIVLEVKLTDSAHFAKAQRYGMGEDVVSQIARNGKAEVISQINCKAEKDILRYYEDVQNVKSFVGVPVFFNHEVVAVLVADSKVEDAYGVETVTTLGQFSKLISALIKSYTEKYDLRRDAEVLMVLDTMHRKLKKNVALETIMDTMVEAITELLDWDYLAISLYDRDYKKWMVYKVASRDRSDYIPEMAEIDFEHSLTGLAIRKGTCTVIDNLEKENVVRYTRDESIPRRGTFLTVPIYYLNKCYGAVSIESRQVGNYSRKDIDILQHLVVGVASAIELLYAVDLLNEHIMIDELTGTYNRKFLFRKIDEEIARAMDYDSDLSFIIISIDNSDALIERYGVQGFDVIVSKVAHLICNSLRHYDVVGRYDASRFGVLLINTNADDAYLWAEKVRRNVASHILSIGGRSFSVTVSAGVCKTVEGMSRDQLISSATQVLAKAEGNTVMVF